MSGTGTRGAYRFRYVLEHAIVAPMAKAVVKITVRPVDRNVCGSTGTTDTCTPTPRSDYSGHGRAATWATAGHARRVAPGPSIAVVTDQVVRGPAHARGWAPYVGYTSTHSTAYPRLRYPVAVDRNRVPPLELRLREVRRQGAGGDRPLVRMS
jgi:hypothetical protein